jgi:hypothetical protein
MNAVVMQLMRDSIFEKSFKPLTIALIRTMEKFHFLLLMRIAISKSSRRAMTTVRGRAFSDCPTSARRTIRRCAFPLSRRLHGTCLARKIGRDLG